MGNRATITLAPFKKTNPAIYVHWNGGRDSIEAFCEAAKLLKYRTPESDPDYALARMIGMICIYFDPTADTSIGVGKCGDLLSAGDDNGCYVLGGNWEIVERRDAEGKKMPDTVDDEYGREGYNIPEMADGIRKQVTAMSIVSDERAVA